ncbi:tigger transposable element-derived protein 6-like [Rhipicephalus sanguineus]|uniref:tigger transposable element-derived protein 6-like n=1 Tax=Rhipicephalus sanguineus TaxID=34632 RepID=UPI0020C48320|nr:tigger transposable element-derived protein 6-like [Rhipicephalus sanguineus]
MAAPQSKKRKFISLEQKAEIVAAAAAGRKKGSIADEYGISPSSLSTILKSEASISKALASGTSAQRKKTTQPVHEDLDKAVYAWFCEMRAKKIPISGNMIQQRALNYACILGIENFKVLCGESGSADSDGASSWIATNAASMVEKYPASDVYNADETGLFYEMLPAKTLDFKGKQCHGGKQSKKRVTVFLCPNMDGSDKRPLFVVGKSAKLRCFKGTKNLPVKYVANNRSWMMRAIFTDWLVAFDNDMKRQNHSVCLLLDNCSAHRLDGNVKLTNVEVKFFPTNCTSLNQPLDEGVINSLKHAYRSRLIQRILLNIEHGRDTKVDLFMAVQMLAAAWMLTRREVVKNCFAHAGFRPEEMSLASPSDDAQAADDDDVVQGQDAATAAAWTPLEEAGIVPEHVALSDYVNADADVIVYEELSDAKILKSARGAAAADSSDDEEVAHGVPTVPTPVTASQVMDSLDIIRSFLGAHDDDVAMQLLADYVISRKAGVDSHCGGLHKEVVARLR